MVGWLRAGEGGDPSRIHAEGMTSRVAVEGARDQVAALLGARPRSVVFTSGATEAIAAAVFGVGGRAAAATRWCRRSSTRRCARPRLGPVR